MREPQGLHSEHCTPPLPRPPLLDSVLPSDPRSPASHSRRSRGVCALPAPAPPVPPARLGPREPQTQPAPPRASGPAPALARGAPLSPPGGEGARARALPAPPTASPQPRRRPRADPGRAGPAPADGPAGGAAPWAPPSARPPRRGREREALCTRPPGLRGRDGCRRGLCGRGAESRPEPEPRREAGGLCAEMAAGAAAAAEEGMEPRALQYEQTLVSEAEPSPEECAPGGCSRAPSLQREDRELPEPRPSRPSWGN